MENSAVAGLRSRSRSKTPFLRSSCDREHCGETEHNHKSGRKTPVGRRTPSKLTALAERHTPEPPLVEDLYTSPPAHRTRSSTAAVTSDYSSEESPDVPSSMEVIQNKINSHYEYSRVTSSSTRRGYDATHAASDFRLSPSQHSSPYPQHVYNASLHRSYSPAHSGCSTDSSFAEQALADISHVREKDRSVEHLPYKLYKMAGEYWNKYPKTDYTYSPLSRDRVELAPGQVAVPNMSRRSLAHYRATGNLTSPEELDQLLRQHGAAWRENYDSSEEEYVKRANGGVYASGVRLVEQRWWITRLLIAIYTTITTTVSETATTLRDKIAGRKTYTPAYLHARPKPGLVSRGAAAAAAPLVWLYRALHTVVTTTTTTISNTMSGGNTEADGAYYAHSAYGASAEKRKEGRRWWLWFLLVPLIGYGSHYTYENFDNLALPDFTDMELALPEFSSLSLPSLPNVTLPFSLPNLTYPNLGLPKLNMSFADLEMSLPDLSEVPQTYYEYKELAQDRLGDASEYVKVVASSCLEEIRRYWNGVF